VNINLARQSGFTLIELIVVIVIIGIMAAVAVPKFVSLQSDARVSVMEGLEGAIRGSQTLVYSKSLIEEVEANATDNVALDATTSVDTVFGYPAGTTSGIEAALELQGDITVTFAAGVATFTYTGQTACVITYTQPAAAGATPVIDASAINTTNC
jgi:MSHA pilin protein MshA